MKDIANTANICRSDEPRPEPAAAGPGRAGLLGLSREKLGEMLLQMVETRAFEEKVAYFFSRAMIHGTTHLYIGEEATAIGAIAALAPGDLVSSTHRGHGHTIAKGVDLKAMMAELFGRKTGACKGKGGSMHIADLEKGHLGANGVVGGGIPIATGAGLSIQHLKQDKVVICFFGDGASNEGTFHESINLAAVWKLPVIYICENNQYGMGTDFRRVSSVTDFVVMGDSYGIPGKQVNGMDVAEVYQDVGEAAEKARETTQRIG